MDAIMFQVYLQIDSEIYLINFIRLYTTQRLKAFHMYDTYYFFVEYCI